MTETDNDGREWSYLASEMNYSVVRDLETRNLIVPITGDFGGPKAIRSVGEYVREHGAVISAFYTSNVEGYLFQGGDRRGNANGGAARFYDNTSTLPLDSSSSFIRWIPGATYRGGNESSIVLEPIRETIEEFRAGRLTGFDFLRRGRIFGTLSGVRRFPSLPNSVGGTVPILFDWAVYEWVAFHILVSAIAFAAGLLLNPEPRRSSAQHTSVLDANATSTSGSDASSATARIFYGAVWAIGGYGLSSLVELAMSSNVASYVNPIRLAIAGAMVAAAIAIVLGVVLGLLLSSHRAFTLRALAPIVMLPVFGVQLVSDINRVLDVRSPIVRTTSVLRRWQEQDSSLWNKTRSYHIEVDTTADSGNFPSRIQVSRRVYESVIEGDTIPIVVGRGALGLQWYRTINGRSLYD
jgi:hypothetical protein